MATVKCRTCGRDPVFWQRLPLPPNWQCGNCAAKASPEALDSDSELRCPKCGYCWRVECEDGVYEDGEHEVSCGECDHGFTVSTRVSFSFKSPPLESRDGSESEEEDEAT